MNEDKLKKVYIAVSKLRGIIPADTVIGIMVYSLFLKYIEGKHKNENAFMIYDEKYTVDYLSVTYGQLVFADDVRSYFRKAETELGIEDATISNGAYSLLSDIEPEKIRLVFSSMTAVDADQYSNYTDIAIYLIEQMTISYGKSFGNFSVNSSVAKLIKRIIGYTSDMVLYDGFCGNGIIAATIADPNSIVYLQDIDPDRVPIAAILAVMRGSKIGSIRCGDSLLDPLDCKSKYDRVVFFPPLVKRYDPEYIKSIPTDNYLEVKAEDKDSIFVRHAIAHIRDDGVAVVIVPMGLLFKSGRVGAAREEYASQYVDAIIELPAGIIMNTMVSTAIVILKKKKTFDGIFMISAKGFSERTDRNLTIITDKGVDEIARIYNNQEIIEGVSNRVPHKVLLENEYNLCVAPYINTTNDKYTEESITPHIEKYNELSAKATEISNKLTALRKRFYN